MAADQRMTTGYESLVAELRKEGDAIGWLREAAGAKRKPGLSGTQLLLSRAADAIESLQAGKEGSAEVERRTEKRRSQVGARAPLPHSLLAFKPQSAIGKLFKVALVKRSPEAIRSLQEAWVSFLDQGVGPVLTHLAVETAGAKAWRQTWTVSILARLEHAAKKDRFGTVIDYDREEMAAIMASLRETSGT